MKDVANCLGVKDLEILCLDDSLTHQSFAAECDIGNIMKKYARTGLIDHVVKYQGQYGDFSNVPDFMAAQNLIVQVHEAFDSLPAQLRARFSNDPTKFLEFVNNPDSAAEMVEMGLIPSFDEKSSQNAPIEPGVPNSPDGSVSVGSGKSKDLPAA